MKFFQHTKQEANKIQKKNKNLGGGRGSFVSYFWESLMIDCCHNTPFIC